MRSAWGRSQAVSVGDAHRRLRAANVSSWTGESSGSRPSTASPAPSRAAPAVPRRGRALPVPPGGVVGPVEQRVPAQRRPALPRRRLAPGVRDAGVRLGDRPGRARQGRRADPGGAARRRRAAAARGGHRGRDLPVQEQHRLGRQLLRLPRELPGGPARRVRPAGRRAHPVPGHPAVDLRRRQGAADAARRGLLPVASGPSTSGRASRRRPPAAGRSSTPGTSRTRTPSGTAGCT